MRALILIAFLAACSSPSLRYVGIEPVTVAVEDWEIDVYSDGSRAQAIRMTRTVGATAELMRARGGVAVTEATGCRLDGRTVRADSNVLDGRLICGGRALR